jgi:hypothetical protein
MKKLMIGLMGLVMMGAMALPAAAQSRNWRQDDQMTFRGENHRRNDFDSSRRDHDERDNRYENGRSWNRDYGFGQDRLRQREQHHGFSFRIRF